MRIPRRSDDENGVKMSDLKEVFPKMKLIRKRPQRNDLREEMSPEEIKCR